MIASALKGATTFYIIALSITTYFHRIVVFIVVMLCVLMLSIDKHSVILMSVDELSVFMLSGVAQIVILANVVAPK